MKKLILIVIVLTTLTGCYKDDILPDVKQEVKPELQIAGNVGIKLSTVFVTNEVSMNVKLDKAGVVTIKIFDIANKVVSKETVTVKEGDNILKVYTSALPSSGYRIGLFDSNNNQLGITDFNKL